MVWMLHYALVLCILLSGVCHAKPASYEGRYSQEHLDDFDRMRAEVKPYIVTDNAETIYLNKASVQALYYEHRDLLKPGLRVSVTGNMVNGEMQLSSVAKSATGLQSRYFSTGVTPKIGVRNILVIPMPFADTTVPVMSQAYIKERVFTDPRSINNIIAQDSWGKYKLNGTVLPAYTMGTQFNSTACDYRAWRDQVFNVILPQNGVTFVYDSIHVIVPNLLGCSWGGIALDVNCQKGIYCITFSKSYSNESMSAVFFHELGHNIAYMHANAIINNKTMEYADYSDPMGSGYALTGFSAVHKYQVDWISLNAGKRIVSPVRGAGQIYTIVPTGTTTEPNNNSTQILSIPTTVYGKSTTLYLSYRVDYGVTALKTYSPNKVYLLFQQVHVQMFPNYVLSDLGAVVQGPARIAILNAAGNEVYFGGVRMVLKSLSMTNATVAIDPTISGNNLFYTGPVTCTNTISNYFGFTEKMISTTGSGANTITQYNGTMTYAPTSRSSMGGNGKVYLRLTSPFVTSIVVPGFTDYGTGSLVTFTSTYGKSVTVLYTVTGTTAPSGYAFINPDCSANLNA